jgi:hypothetical protein
VSDESRVFALQGERLSNKLDSKGEEDKAREGQESYRSVSEKQASGGKSLRARTAPAEVGFSP